MTIDPTRLAFFIPGHLQRFKLKLFERVGSKIRDMGGYVVHADYQLLHEATMQRDRIPIIGCTPELRPFLNQWIAAEKDWIYWDRGYARRVFATWLPPGEDGGYYRWHLNSYQMEALRSVPDDRWRALAQPLDPWNQGKGKHVVVAAPSPTYQRFHQIEGWTEQTVELLRKHTDRELQVREKEDKLPLGDQCREAHALVTHGSNAAVEAAIMGCPVFVSKYSAAALIGQTDFTKIESPLYPDREPWVRSLAYCQFDEAELVDGTLWRLLA